MPRFDETFIQQVQQATDIVDLVEQYVALKKRGKEFVGLCPFHQDTHPSMYVSPAKQIFKCFACGAGGTAFNFVMLYDKLTFPETVRRLAERAGIPLPRQVAEPDQPSGLSKNDLLAACLFAARWFREQLHAPGGQAALDYAHGRGLTDASIQRFGLGYAPDAWDALLKAATAAGHSDRQLAAAGLVIRKDDPGRCYDRFRNRLIFPILDVDGRPVAFGGRTMSDEDAKYLNSPETPLFDKSNMLYGLNWARKAIVSSGQVIVAEGYLDALMPMQAGVDNVVATLGTSLTDRHVTLLARYARDVVLLFDADTAGAAAAERALETFLTQKFHVRVGTIPAGTDPCDLVLAEGPDALRAIVDESPDALHYVWQRTYDSWTAAGRPADRQQIVERFLQLVASSSVYGAIDEVRRGQLAQHIAHVLNVPAADLQQQMRRLSRRLRGSGGSGAAPRGTYAAERLAERHLLEVLLNAPQLFDTAAERVDPKDFEDAALRTIAERFWKLAHDGRAHLDDLLASEALAEHGALLADLATAGEQRGNYEATLVGALDDMVYRRRRAELHRLRSSELTDDALRELSDRFREVDARRHPKIS
ncbi:MAG: DNA primase [Phycisphaerae bacterium]|nr:DNA primase [Phycisphaerae bacterium]